MNTDDTALPAGATSAVVFVYGTLKRGGHLHAHMAGATFLGEDRITGRLYEVDDGPFRYPALDDGNGVVHGECFRVDGPTLRRLDAVEGAPDWFMRCRVRTAAGRVAYAYFWNGAVEGLRPLPDGRFAV